MVEREPDAKLDKVFATFGEQALGSAPLAQGHRATPRDGRPVAVNVAAPRIVEGIHEDLQSLASLAGKADRCVGSALLSDRKAKPHEVGDLR